MDETKVNGMIAFLRSTGLLTEAELKIIWTCQNEKWEWELCFKFRSHSHMERVVPGLLRGRKGWRPNTNEILQLKGKMQEWVCVEATFDNDEDMF